MALIKELCTIVTQQATPFPPPTLCFLLKLYLIPRCCAFPFSMRCCGPRGCVLFAKKELNIRRKTLVLPLFGSPFSVGRVSYMKPAQEALGHFKGGNSWICLSIKGKCNQNIQEGCSF